MKGSRGVWIALFLVVVFGGLLMVPSGVLTEQKPALGKDDCIKCHTSESTEIMASGGKHKDDVGCMDCHTGHRPTSKNNIPKCDTCHEGKDHYKLKDCLNCHKNPHTPFNIVLQGQLTDPCLSCHKEQIKQLKDFPSRHTARACSNCHDVHRKVPDCVKCHKPHTPDMPKESCKNCHKAHMPKEVKYGPTTANKDCGACHKAAMTQLAATETKHKNVNCVDCHKDKHKAQAACNQCHDKQHPAKMLQKFPKCSMCHNTAHDLNNFTPAQGQKPAAPAVTPATGKKK